MYQTIGEEIAVIGVYKKGAFQPVKFQWGQREYKVDKITLISDIKDGGVRRRLYSVLVGVNVYRILFDRDQEKWTLEELWVE